MKIIGTNKDSDIMISGKYVSGHHALLIEEGEFTYIEDLESTFGTYINGKKITVRSKLNHTDRVKIGTQLFHWKDYIGVQDKLGQNPVFLVDLIKPTGTIKWKDYKSVLLISLGLLILIPLFVPALLMFTESTLNRRISETAIPIDLTQYTGLLFWSISILAGYVFINLTQKVLRAK